MYIILGIYIVLKYCVLDDPPDYLKSVFSGMITCNSNFNFM